MLDIRGYRVGSKANETTFNFSSGMKPLSTFPQVELNAIRGVFTDIDDTLTTDGRLTAEAYTAMERLRLLGLAVVPVTGRPAGWCDHIARMWPVDGVVGESGAFYFRYDREKRHMSRHYSDGDRKRAANRKRLAALARPSPLTNTTERQTLP